MDTKTARNVVQIVVAALLFAVGYVIGDLVSKGEFSGLAAWVQAVGTVVAIYVAVRISMAQTERLNQDAIDREHQKRIDQYREVEKVLRETGKRAFRAMNNVAAFFSTREKVGEFAAQGFAVKDLAGLKRLEEAISAIPLLQVSDDHVETVLNLGGYLTEFIHHVETAVGNHRTMNEEEYRKFFTALRIYLSGIRSECVKLVGAPCFL